MYRYSLNLIIILLAFTAALHAEEKQQVKEVNKEAAKEEPVEKGKGSSVDDPYVLKDIVVFGDEDAVFEQAGSGAFIGHESLEAHNYSDINRIKGNHGQYRGEQVENLEFCIEYCRNNTGTEPSQKCK